MESAEHKILCPHCFQGHISDEECSACETGITTKEGVPSFSRKDGDPQEERLRTLAKAEEDNLDDLLSQVREDYMDGSVVDRFFKTRTVCWRVLVSSRLSGRGLVIGDHEEKVGILLSEVLDETFTVDTSVARLRAQSAVAKATGTKVNPVHSSLEDLPFPEEGFEVIVVDCRASQVGNYLSHIGRFLTEDGAIILLVDGWTRESGVTGLVGLGNSPEGSLHRVYSGLQGHSFGISRAVRAANLETADKFALLSTNRHENQRAFSVDSQAALNWLLYGSDRTDSTKPLTIARYLSRCAQKTGALRQCYPRYLFVCSRNSGNNRADHLIDSIQIAGKNRSTVLGFQNGSIDTIRKIPNSRRQSKLNKKAQTAIDAVSGPILETIPNGNLAQSEFSLERHEKPVSGTPLDQTLESTSESVERHLDIVFDWLIKFQQANIVKWVEKSPEEIEQELMIGEVGLSNPPEVGHKISVPQVISHGDLFGSNIYIQNGKVSSVIDWEWAEHKGNPITDVGFFLLQLAEWVGDNFRDGFKQVFLTDEQYMSHIYANVRDYCNKIGIEPFVFVIYLSISYIKRIRKDIGVNKRLDINWPVRIRYVWENDDFISNSIYK